LPEYFLLDADEESSVYYGFLDNTFYKSSSRS